MKKTTLGLLMFTAGAGLGAVSAWFVAKIKYEKYAIDEINKAEEEFNELRKLYRESVYGVDNTNDEPAKAEKTDIKIDGVNDVNAAKAKNKPDLMEYAKQIKNNNYVTYSSENEAERKTRKKEYITEEETDMTNIKQERPYIITPDEFSENPDYDICTLYYFADGVVTDENEQPIEEDDVEYDIGLESLEHFGEYEQDSVYVRNDNTNIDYEILRDLRNFSEIEE